ncbi:MAG: hypothetical protein ABIY55_09765, partial [Kofleriaceae bacterium]
VGLVGFGIVTGTLAVDSVVAWVIGGTAAANPDTVFDAGESFAAAVENPTLERSLPSVINVTAESIQRVLQGSRMLSQQEKVSLPVVQNYVNRLLSGEVAPAIKVAGDVIVDGVHRYVAGSVVGRLPDFQEWLAPRNPIMYPLSNIVVDIYDWGNR